MAKQDGTMKTEIMAGRIVKGMTFSQRVWAETRKIPRGEVRTYADLARQLGTRGCRAVGQALGRNPYAPEVPCHRVIASDGRLGGYAGGLDKKLKMLRAEGIRFVGDRVDLAQRRV